MTTVLLKALYAEIDRLSFEAAKLAAANEYDKLVSAIGAKGTNAYTWVEQTVYVNDIPSNELERWFALESERFRRPILRLFHTELETVFEEYNISQDKDFRKTLKAMQETLTPTHPYGTQTTLGQAHSPRKILPRPIFTAFLINITCPTTSASQCRAILIRKKWSARHPIFWQMAGKTHSAVQI